MQRQSQKTVAQVKGQESEKKLKIPSSTLGTRIRYNSQFSAKKSGFFSIKVTSILLSNQFFVVHEI